jgi:serine/threonine protein kinase
MADGDAPRPMTLAAGTTFGPYEVLSPIGAGGMGQVYRARDSRLGREVAFKVLPADFASDPDRVRRFEQEAIAAGALNHPNILSIYDVGRNDGSPYLVSELLEGETLASELASGRLGIRRTLDYAVQIARGLAAAHERGIVHRDLKPANVFVTRDGRLKILDFGLAKLVASEPETSLTRVPTAGTAPCAIIGTLGYISPEQLRGRPADPRSDIFSFGAILYEMLSGKRAFQGDSAADTMSAILRDDPPDLSFADDGVPFGLQRVFRHCLEKSPERRYQSAHDLAFDLESSSPPGESFLPAHAPSAESQGRQMIAAGFAVALALAVGYVAGALSEKAY